MELRKLKGKGADTGKCLTDGLNKTLSLEDTIRYVCGMQSVVYLLSQDTCCIEVLANMQWCETRQFA